MRERDRQIDRQTERGKGTDRQTYREAKGKGQLEIYTRRKVAEAEDIISLYFNLTLSENEAVGNDVRTRRYRKTFTTVNRGRWRFD